MTNLTRNNEHPLTSARLRRARARVHNLGGGFCQFHWYRIIVPHFRLDHSLLRVYQPDYHRTDQHWANTDGPITIGAMTLLTITAVPILPNNHY